MTRSLIKFLTIKAVPSLLHVILNLGKHLFSHYVCSVDNGYKQLTYDAPDVVPDGDRVGGGLRPVKVVVEVIGQPEEERVVHQLQTEVGKRILKQNDSPLSRIMGTIWCFF